jgi:hypothetical protein
MDFILMLGDLKKADAIFQSAGYVPAFKSENASTLWPRTTHSVGSIFCTLFAALRWVSQASKFFKGTKHVNLGGEHLKL